MTRACSWPEGDGYWIWEVSVEVIVIGCKGKGLEGKGIW